MYIFILLLLIFFISFLYINKKNKVETFNLNDINKQIIKQGLNNTVSYEEITTSSLATLIIKVENKKIAFYFLNYKGDLRGSYNDEYLISIQGQRTLKKSKQFLEDIVLDLDDTYEKIIITKNHFDFKVTEFPIETLKEKDINTHYLRKFKN
ncbi:MAG: hypothetical protein R3Y21_05190 [Mycoplasmatota bacterium]